MHEMNEVDVFDSSSSVVTAALWFLIQSVASLTLMLGQLELLSIHAYTYIL